MILIKLGQHVNEMMAVAVKKFQNFYWSRFLIIRQNVNMATNAILNCGLTPHECAFHIGILVPLFYFVSFIAVLSCIILYKIYSTATALF